MSFSQYIKDTKAELKHVAWPTQTQTIIYTALVAGISIIVALYIGFFDFFFTRGLEELIGSEQSSITTPPADTTQQPIDFNVVPGSGSENMPTITNEPVLEVEPEVQ